jgi:hypothetical protein
VLHKYVPKRLIDRPKMGLGYPLIAGCEARCGTGAENLMGEDRLRREGYLNLESIRRKWMNIYPNAQLELIFMECSDVPIVVGKLD